MVELRGTVTFSVDGRRGSLVARGRRLAIDLETPTIARELGGRRSARSVASALDRAGLTLELSAGRVPLAVVGRDAKPGLLSRILRMGSVQLERGAVRELRRARTPWLLRWWRARRQGT